MNRPLIFIPSPRNIPEFNDACSKLDCDKLWVKYYPEHAAYINARDWFLEHKEYTHLCILPDDLIVSAEDFIMLSKSAEFYNVMSGWCRNTIRQRRDWYGEPETEDTADSNVSFTTLPPDPPMVGRYEQYNFASVQSMYHQRAAICRVMFAGFPPTFISRKVVEEVPFRWEFCCIDSCFALDLDKKGIKQWCDVRVRTVHLNMSELDQLLVGKKESKMIFESCR